MENEEKQLKIKEENQACVMKIRGLLHGRGKSITAMEAELGFGNGSVGKWSSGVRRPPLERLLRIAEYLKVSVEEIYPGIMKTKIPAAKTGDGRYGLSVAQWKQIGSLFRTKLLSMPKAPAWLATAQTGLSEADVEAFLAGERYVTKAQIHAMSDLMDLTLWDVIGAYAQAFDGEEDVDIANRQEAIEIIGSYDSESLAQALSYLRYLAASSNPPQKQSQEDA